MQQPYLTAYQQIPADGSVLDIGCLGFQHVAIAQQLGLTDLRHAGVDFVESNAPLPEGFEFRKADLNQEPLPFADDRFDLVVASHVIEHLRDPVAFFGECVRVCKPGGLIYVAAPSERSLLLPGMPFEHHKFTASRSLMIRPIWHGPGRHRHSIGSPATIAVSP
ncbi:MAG: class I SAM-dependent methyltransferase [Chloroflexaceae bacterium]|nr:class I SAM-dependent methyltransferase [Chloroflexaceae bacterium]